MTPEEESSVDPQTFSMVWYRSRPIGSLELTMKGMEDRGSLRVSPGKLVFHGKKGTVEISNISDVSTKRHGRDFVNRWITVSYGGGQTALFVDGAMLGWAGILGGNKRLHAAIDAAATSPTA